MKDYIEKDKTIIFSPYYNKPLDVDLVLGYKKIIFSDYELSDDIIDSYTNNNFSKLKYKCSSFNQSIDNFSLKKCLKNENIGQCICCFNTLTHLTFGNNFNKPVDNLPGSITNLTFGNNFNKPVDNLPCSITNLTFYGSFNQLVDNLPCSITNLTFGYHFNQTVDNLPCSITSLTFGAIFDKSVDNLPNSIINLTFGSKFNQLINNLPTRLKKIECFHKYIYKNYYKNIKIETY